MEVSGDTDSSCFSYSGGGNGGGGGKDESGYDSVEHFTTVFVATIGD